MRWLRMKLLLHYLNVWHRCPSCGGSLQSKTYDSYDVCVNNCGFGDKK